MVFAVMGLYQRPSRREILQRLQEFARDAGRPPRAREPGLENLVYAAKKEFGSWEHALKIAGLQTYSAWRRKKSFASEIRRLLNNNPMTVKELRKALSESSNCTWSITRFFVTIRQASDINSLGQRRSRVYFLEGQENLARNKLYSMQMHLAQRIWTDSVEPLTKFLRNEVKFFSDMPAEYRDIVKKYPDIFRVTQLKIGRGSRVSRSGHEIFGNLSGRRIVSLWEDNERLLDFLSANISKPRTSHEMAGLTARLKQNGFTSDEIATVYRKMGITRKVHGSSFPGDWGK